MLHNGLSGFVTFDGFPLKYRMIDVKTKKAIFEKFSFGAHPNMMNSFISIVLLFSHRSTLRTMRLVILVCQLGLIVRIKAQIPEICNLSNTNRPPGLWHFLSFLFE